MNGKLTSIGVGGLLFLSCNLFGQASSCVAPPSGLVAWWQSEGNANDSAGLNEGTLDGNVTFVPGEVGQAFDFGGTNSDVHIPASSSLNVGAGSGFTIEMWINPSNITEPEPLLQWNDVAPHPYNPYYGVSVWLSLPATNDGAGPGSLSIDVTDKGQDHNVVSTSAPVISYGWQHIAATYDQASGIAALYLDGELLAVTNIGAFTPATTQDLCLGYAHDQFGDDLFSSIGNGNAWFKGQMDEISIYNRALSSTEIQAIYAAGSSGKCSVPPTLAVISPPNETVAEGETTTFSAMANGSAPVTFQWQFDGTNIVDATNETLVLTNVLISQAGNYTVEAINLEGTNVSSNAILNVLPSYSPLWVQTSAPTNQNWDSLACSSDGKKIIAASAEGYIYTSGDGGMTWISNNVPLIAWTSVASSADGMKLTASATGPGAIWTSTNSGANWQLSTNLGTYFIASSADGNTLAFTGSGTHGIYVSTNSGASWTFRFNLDNLSIAGSSANMSKLFGIDVDSDVVYVSTNLAASWTSCQAPTNYHWADRLACSSDGTKIALAPLNSNSPPTAILYGPIFMSTNSGNSWQATSSPQLSWGPIASSADGEKLVAGVWGGYLYVSTDGGNDWIVTRSPNAQWGALASSADGTRLVAAAYLGPIYIWHPTALSFVVSGDDLTIAWPTNDPAFVLQENSTMSVVNWVDVTNLPMITNSNYQVIVPITGGSKYFRLEYP